MVGENFNKGENEAKSHKLFKEMDMQSKIKLIKIGIISNFIVSVFFVYYPSGSIIVQNVFISALLFFIQWLLPIIILLFTGYIAIKSWFKFKKEELFFLGWVLFHIIVVFFWVIHIAEDV